jgi:hypothetical protein
MSELDDILSVHEAADIAGKDAEAIRKALQRGSLRGRQLGRQWVTTRAELTRWLAWSPVHRRNDKRRRDRYA